MIYILYSLFLNVFAFCCCNKDLITKKIKNLYFLIIFLGIICGQDFKPSVPATNRHQVMSEAVNATWKLLALWWSITTIKLLICLFIVCGYDKCLCCLTRVTFYLIILEIQDDILQILEAGVDFSLVKNLQPFFFYVVLLTIYCVIFFYEIKGRNRSQNYKKKNCVEV